MIIVTASSVAYALILLWAALHADGNPLSDKIDSVTVKPIVRGMKRFENWVEKILKPIHESVVGKR